MEDYYTISVLKCFFNFLFLFPKFFQCNLEEYIVLYFLENTARYSKELDITDQSHTP